MRAEVAIVKETAWYAQPMRQRAEKAEELEMREQLCCHTSRPGLGAGGATAFPKEEGMPSKGMVN